MLGDLVGLCSRHARFFFFVTCFPFLQTTALKNGSLRHDIHYWIGKDTSQVYFSYHLVILFGKVIESIFICGRMKLELLQF